MAERRCATNKTNPCMGQLQNVAISPRFLIEMEEKKKKKRRKKEIEKSP